MSKKILTTIVNHNYNAEAVNLKCISSETFDTIIIDSGSEYPPEYFDIKLPNVGYSGLFNQAVKETLEKGYDWLLFICSDVVLKKSDFEKMKNYINELPENVGVYSPASSGQSHKHCKPQKTDTIRDVAFVEGFMFAARKEILEKIYPVNVDINKLGHGLDAYKGYLCLKNNMRCVIDDRLTVYHREGTGYDVQEASKQFFNWMSQEEKKEFLDFWNVYLQYGSDNTVRMGKNNIIKNETN